jgi:hypothetical protein
MLLVSPFALAYHFTPLSFTAINRLLILYFLLLAHVSFFLVLRNFSRTGSAAVGVLAVALVYSELIHWSLEGFYDVAMVAPLVLSAGFLAARRGLAAVIAYCAAVFIHFRALFFAPLCIAAICLLVREREWIWWRTRDWIGAAAAAMMAAGSLYSFWLLWPFLSAQSHDPNPVRWGVAAGFWTFLGLTALVATLLVVARSWLDFVMTAWMWVMWMNIPFAHPWYIVVMLAWLGSPSEGPPERAHLVRDARVAFTLIVSTFVCHYFPIPDWLLKL